MKRFEIRTIKNDADLAWAVGQIDLFWAAEEGTPEFEYLMVLSDLASNYEDTRYPVQNTDPVDKFCFHMEQNDLDQKALATVLHSKSRASEILSRKKALSIAQIRASHNEWHLPAEILIRETRLAVKR